MDGYELLTWINRHYRYGIYEINLEITWLWSQKVLNEDGEEIKEVFIKDVEYSFNGTTEDFKKYISNYDLNYEWDFYFDDVTNIRIICISSEPAGEIYESDLEDEVYYESYEEIKKCFFEDIAGDSDD